MRKAYQLRRPKITLLYILSLRFNTIARPITGSIIILPINQSLEEVYTKILHNPKSKNKMLKFLIRIWDFLNINDQL